MIYFNQAAESWPKPLPIQEVVNGLPYYDNGRSCNCNKDEDISNRLRNKLKKFLNIPNKFEVTITGGATESANLILNSLLKYCKSVGYYANCHNCIIRTCYAHSKDSSLISPGCWKGKRVICINHQSNVDGKIHDIAKEIEFAKEIEKKIFEDEKPILVIDISQSIGNVEIDISKWDYDNLYIFGTFHKNMQSICGCGFVIHPKENHGLIPLIYGGTGYETTRVTQPEVFPYNLESGSRNALAIVAAIKSIDITDGMINQYHMVKMELIDYFINNWIDKTSTSTKYYFQIHHIENSPIICLIPKTATVGETIGQTLEKKDNIITRYGYHCSPLYALNTSCSYYKLQGTLRLSFGTLNTKSEIDQFYEALNNRCFELYAKERKNSK